MIHNQNQQTPVVICGMHRSGTSLITQILHDCGLYLGPEDQFLETRLYDNPTGYWEFAPIMKFSDRLLREIGASWKDIAPLFSETWLDEISLEEKQREAEESLAPLFNQGSAWGWKDPRTTVLLPFWKTCFPEIKLVVCVRNPLEVAYSLSKRVISHVDFEPGLKLWREYYEILQRDLSNGHTLFVHYERLFHSPKEEISRLCDFAGLSLDGEKMSSAIARIKPEYYRGVATDELLEAFPNLPDGILELYAKLCERSGKSFRAGGGAESQTGQNDLQILLRMYQTSTSGFDRFMRQVDEDSTLINQQNTQIRQIVLEKKTFENSIRKKDERIEQQDKRIEQQQENIKTLKENLLLNQNKIKESNALIGQQKLDLTQKNKQIQSLKNALRSQTEQVSAANSKLNRMEQELLFYALSKSWRITRPFRKMMNLIKGEKHG